MALPGWSDPVIYQIYLRSFADADGDGIGDLAGLRERLDHLVRLGVDALWLNPCYPSPQRDHGYDIADYFGVDPVYGSVAGLAELVDVAHQHGIKVLLDMVANHCSDQHPWFQAALVADPGSAERDRFVFRDGAVGSETLPPNNWMSVFGGPAWTRVPGSDGADGQWYLHSFDASQPDLNWRNAEVREHFEQVLRFWFDLGVDGFRIDVAHGMVVAEGLPDVPEGAAIDGSHPMWDQPEVHEIYRSWRRIADDHPGGPRYFIGEIWVQDPERLRQYLASDELHQAFCFDLLVQPWRADRLRAAVDRCMAGAASAGVAPAWTLNSHDVHRVVTRYGQPLDLTPPDPDDLLAAARRTGSADLATGRARARAAAMLLLALPGSVFLYQGEELGLPEVLDLPPEARQDPIWVRSGGAQLGRDGCRVPLPWRADHPRFGFSNGSQAEPWLPVPEDFGAYAADLQAADPGSFLTLYRSLVGSRRHVFEPGSSMRWLAAPPGVLAFARGDGVCVVNVDGPPLRLPATLADAVLIDTGMDGTRLPADAGMWLKASRFDEPIDVRTWTGSSRAEVAGSR